MRTNTLKTIDGRNLYYIFLAGAQKIFNHQAELNRMNVFPVSDHDTGTNLASTVRSVMTNLKPHPSIKKTADLIAEAALVGARGNSGIIFAQFLYGFSTEIADKQSLTYSEFARGLRKSIELVYKAVSEPVEGTMLTVMREWSEFLFQRKEKINDFIQAILESMDVLNQSLQETKNKLGVLSKHNVVDAGAKGFVLFMDGILELIRRGNFRQLRKNNLQITSDPIHESDIANTDLSHRYCTEALIKKSTIKNEVLRKILLNFGDSVVIAGSQQFTHIHVHTDRPADLFDTLKERGTLTFQKVDDMVRQQQIVYNRKWPIALVTDSTCDLDEKILDDYQIHMLPINIQFGENHYLDKLTLKPKQFYRLLDRKPEFPKTSQINEKAFLDLFSRLASHYKSVIAVHLTGKFSGTYENGRKAGKMIEKKTDKRIDVINSKNLSGGLGLLVLRIAEAIEDGLSHEKIMNSIESWIADIRIYVSVRTLEYMVRGGRVSYVKGKLAKWLNINPIVSLDEKGASKLFDKAFSQKSNMRKVMRTIIKETENQRIWNYIILHAQNPEAADWYSNEMKILTGMPPISTVNISPVIGMHTGIGAAAIAYMLE
jgi:DegV family protein with EDD domain